MISVKMSDLGPAKCRYRYLCFLVDRVAPYARKWDPCSWCIKLSENPSLTIHKDDQCRIHTIVDRGKGHLYQG